MKYENHKFLTCFIIGITGTVLLDDNADREPNYWVWSYGPKDDELTPWMDVLMTRPPDQVKYSDF